MSIMDTKPFSAEELMARLEAVLRRYQTPEVKEPPILTIGELSIDFAQRTVSVGGQEVSLSPTKYRLFHCLATSPGTVLTHNYLLEKVWGPNYKGEYEILRITLWRLRQKLEEDPATPGYILTRPGMGYMLTAAK